MAKRGFYGIGPAKDFGKRDFFEAVLAYVNGDEVDQGILDLLALACEYELETIELRKTSGGTKSSAPKTLEEKLQGDYVSAVRQHIIPIMSKTTPLALIEILGVANSKGLVYPKTGKPWLIPNLTNAFKVLVEAGILKEAGVKIIEKVVEKNGLKSTSQEPKPSWLVA